MTDMQECLISTAGNALAPPEEPWDYYVPPRWLVEHPEVKARNITPCMVLKPVSAMGERTETQI